MNHPIASNKREFEINFCQGQFNKIGKYITNGGFLFAMCSATDSFDIALAAHKTDIVASVFDGTPVDSDYYSKLDFSNSIAFENYTLYTDPMIYEYSSIDWWSYNLKSSYCIKN